MRSSLLSSCPGSTPKIGHYYEMLELHPSTPSKPPLMHKCQKLGEMGRLHFLLDKMGLDKMGLDEMG